MKSQVLHTVCDVIFLVKLQQKFELDHCSVSHWVRVYSLKLQRDCWYHHVGLCCRILLCAMCGDPYPVELILGPLLHHQSSWRSPAHSDAIILETYLGYEKKKVMITLTSYHSKFWGHTVRPNPTLPWVRLRVRVRVCSKGREGGYAWAMRRRKSWSPSPPTTVSLDSSQFLGTYILSLPLG